LSQSETETKNAPHTAMTPTAVSPATAADQLPRVVAGVDRGLLGLPRTYWLLWTGMLLNRLGGSVFCLLSIYLTSQRGFSPELAGLVMCLYAAGSTIAGPLGGALADRVGRRATLIASTACAGTLMLALGYAPTSGAGAILVLAPALGFFSDLCRPPLQAAVADVVAPAQRVRAYALLYWAINLGFAGAAAFGGALAEHHFGLLFLIDALTTFAFGVIVLVGVPETRPASALAPGHPRRPGAHALLEPFRDRRFMTFVATQFLLLLAFAQVFVSLPLDMRAHGLGTLQIGWLLGLNGVLIVIAQPIALRFVRGFSDRQWLAAGAALTGIGLGVNALAGGAPVYAVSAVLWTLGEIGFSSATPALIAERSPIDRRGAYQGTYQFAWGVATMGAPVLGALILARLGGPVLWLGCLVACVGSAALNLTRMGR
jgi:MFS family permease